MYIIITHSRRIILTGLVFLMASCVEPFEPEISRYEDIIVVYGTFTDKDEDHYVNISQTTGYYDYDKRRLSGAVVALEDSEGNMATYQEVSDGRYCLPEGSILPVIGRSYRIVIEIPNGSRYASDFEELLNPAKIDSIYYEPENEAATETGEKLQGLQMYVDSKSTASSTRYYRWDWNETWEYYVPHSKPGYENRRTCWKTTGSSQINIADTRLLSEDFIYKHKLHFINTSTNKLIREYSTEVSQYTISQRAYNYWKQLEQTNEQSGSLFDPPPTSPAGNLESLNSDQAVLGYFQVSGVSRKRIFISRDDLPDSFSVKTGYEHCESITVLGLAEAEQRSGWILLYQYTWMDTIYTSLTNHYDCYDCTTTGTTKKPDFWIE